MKILGKNGWIPQNIWDMEKSQWFDWIKVNCRFPESNSGIFWDELDVCMLIHYCVHAHAGLGTTFGWKAPSRYWSSILVDVMNVNTSLINPQLIRGSILIVLIYTYFPSLKLRGNHPLSVREILFGLLDLTHGISSLFQQHWCFARLGAPKTIGFMGSELKHDEFWMILVFLKPSAPLWGVKWDHYYRWGCTSWNWRFFFASFCLK